MQHCKAWEGNTTCYRCVTYASRHAKCHEATLMIKLLFVSETQYKLHNRGKWHYYASNSKNRTWCNGNTLLSSVMTWIPHFYPPFVEYFWHGTRERGIAMVLINRVTFVDKIQLNYVDSFRVLIESRRLKIKKYTPNLCDVTLSNVTSLPLLYPKT